MPTKRELITVLIGGIIINVVMAAVNADKGGWWTFFVPLHFSAAASCGYALGRILKT